MSGKKITSRPNSPVLEEFLLSVCEQDIQKLMKCSVDDLTSLQSDLLNPDMDLSDVPLPNGKDFREASVGYIYALATVMGEFLVAQRALGGDSSAQVEKVRARRAGGEAVGQWRPITPEEMQ
jgi:hypothetical protein